MEVSNNVKFSQKANVKKGEEEATNYSRISTGPGFPCLLTDDLICILLSLAMLWKAFSAEDYYIASN